MAYMKHKVFVKKEGLEPESESNQVNQRVPDSNENLEEDDKSNCEFDIASVSLSDFVKYESESDLKTNELPKKEAWVNKQRFQEPEVKVTHATTSFDLDSEIFADVENFIYQPAPKGTSYKCTILRDRRGFSKNINPVYSLYIQTGPDQQTFLLAGKKNSWSSDNQFLIATDPDVFVQNKDACVAKISSNLFGTAFTLHHTKMKTGFLPQELGAVVYHRGSLGLKGPRKFHFIVPALDDNSKRIEFISPRSNTSDILNSYKKKDLTNLICYRNRSPDWNEITRCYVLNLNGRVKQASIKNFKIIDQADNTLVMLFGKTSRDTFVMDFSHPLCAVQAFGLALSTFKYI